MLTVVVGAGLGVAGAMVQSLTRNHLDGPGVEVDSGAAFAVVCAITYAGVTCTLGTMTFALLDAGSVAMQVFAAGARNERAVVMSVAAVGITLLALTARITLLYRSSLRAYRQWSISSVANRDPTVLDTAATGPIAFVGLLMPDVARLPVGTEHRLGLPLPALTSPLLLLGSGTVGRAMLPTGELPI